jgi:hypothetical protein
MVWLINDAPDSLIADTTVITVILYLELKEDFALLLWTVDGSFKQWL